MESRLTNHPWVAASAAVPLAGRRQSVGAAVILTPEGKKQLLELGRRDMAKHLRLHLAQYFEAVLLPRRWRFPDRLPINERGKLTHTALAMLFTSIEDERATA
jgi:acyl-coenzyme A synthetase/AMP-(fatty) acid ligase